MAATQFGYWPIRAQAELEKRRRIQSIQASIPTDWRGWITQLFGQHIGGGFASHHVELWRWLWGIKKEERPHPFVAIWPREGGKSTSAELAAVALGARGIRSYIWYVRETQDQADRSVINIMDLLESASIEKYYPALGRREIGKYGKPRGWRRQQLRTASGFVVDAIGLDTAVRGAKVKEQRPDFMIFDDIDAKHDTPKTTKKKIDTLTTSLLPAGSQNLAVLAIQNLIIPDGIFAKLADLSETGADFLADRIVSGPHPAVIGAAVEQQDGRFILTGGKSTWLGQSLALCQSNIDTWGYTAWLQEAQHEVDDPLGGIWDHIEFQHCEWDEIPDIVRGAVWVDPAVTSTDQSDAMGIQADGLGEDKKLYRFYSWEAITSPEDALRRAILKCLELGFTTVGVETDQGGDTWQSVYRRVWRLLVESGIIWTTIFERLPEQEKQITDAPQQIKTAERFIPMFKQAKAGAGHGSKAARNQQMLVDYEHGKIIHVRGTHRALERALKRFPLKKPYDLVDASFWSWRDLMRGGIFFA